MKPRLLDLFCGAGGAAMGYHRAGFDVVGVDLHPQPNYPFEFHQADALTYPLDGYDAVHASPPCQAFTQMSARWRGKGTKADEHPDHLTPTRERLRQLTVPWVIENVPGAVHHMEATISLHGGMFGLGVHRPRLFESNVMLLAPRAPSTRQPIGVYGTKPDGRTTYRYRNNGNYKGKSLIRAAKSIEEASTVMGIEWMTWTEIREAIPPAYTEHIGRQLLAQLSSSPALPPMRAGTPRATDPPPPPVARGGERPSRALPPPASGGREAAGANGGGADRSAPGGSPTNHAEAI